MDLQLTKLELIEMLLNTKKESVLNKVKAILEEDQSAISLSKSDYEMLDKRRESHLNEESASYTWDEVKHNVRASK